MVKKCAIACCESSNGPFFAFPQYYRDAERLKKWLIASGNISLLDIPKEKLKNRFVCKKHFSVQSFIQKKLSPTAVPTLHLPKQIGIIY